MSTFVAAGGVGQLDKADYSLTTKVDGPPRVGFSLWRRTDCVRRLPIAIVSQGRWPRSRHVLEGTDLRGGLLVGHVLKNSIMNCAAQHTSNVSALFRRLNRVYKWTRWALLLPPRDFLNQCLYVAQEKTVKKIYLWVVVNETNIHCLHRLFFELFGFLFYFFLFSFLVRALD